MNALEQWVDDTIVHMVLHQEEWPFRAVLPIPGTMFSACLEVNYFINNRDNNAQEWTLDAIVIEENSKWQTEMSMTISSGPKKKLAKNMCEHLYEAESKAISYINTLCKKMKHRELCWHDRI